MESYSSKVLFDNEMIGGTHIYYRMKEERKYIQNVLSYIVSGIQEGSQIFYIENEKLSNLVRNELNNLLTTEELGCIHFLDNFEFYFKHGDFHAETIADHFSEMIESYISSQTSVRTWAHVEWRNSLEITQKIEEFEQMANHILSTMNVTAVCVYDEKALTEKLHVSLLKCHDFHMTDEGVTILK